MKFVYAHAHVLHVVGVKGCSKCVRALHTYGYRAGLLVGYLWYFRTHQDDFGRPRNCFSASAHISAHACCERLAAHKMSLKELRNSFVVTLAEMGCTTRQIKQVLSMECNETIRLLSYEHASVANIQSSNSQRQVQRILKGSYIYTGRSTESPLQMIMEAIKVSFAFYL